MINKNFNLLFVASIISTLGASISYIAIYWEYMERTNVISLTFLTVATFLARFLCGLFLSPISDRFRAKSVLIVTMVIRAILLSLIAFLLLYLSISIHFLVLLLIVLVGLDSVFDPSSLKIITSIVNKEDYTKANAYISLIDRVGVLIGFLLGGAFISFVNIELLLFVESIAFFAGAIFIFLIKVENLEGPDDTIERKNYFSEWFDGISFIFKNKWLLSILVMAISANLAITPTVTLIAPYASEILNGDSLIFSLLQLSNILGSMIIAFLISKIKLKRIINLFILACFGQSIIIVIFGFNNNFFIACILLASIGGFVALFNVPFVTLLQNFVPNNILGRVRGSMVALSTGISSLGYSISGVLASNFGLNWTFLFYGIVGTSILLIVLIFNPFKVLKSSILKESPIF